MRTAGCGVIHSVGLERETERMRKAVILTTAVLFTALSAPMAFAGPYTDDLSKCLVRSSSDTDKVILVKWIFALLTLNPAVKSLSSVTDDQRQALDKDGALLMQRLILTDCHDETVAALKNEGMEAAQSSFQVLGQVAGRSLFSDPAVQKGMQGFMQYIDQDKWSAISKEAGVPVPATAK
jgi:hypothetical protein